MRVAEQLHLTPAEVLSVPAQHPAGASEPFPEFVDEYMAPEALALCKVQTGTSVQWAATPAFEDLFHLLDDPAAPAHNAEPGKIAHAEAPGKAPALHPGALAMDSARPPAPRYPPGDWLESTSLIRDYHRQSSESGQLKEMLTDLWGQVDCEQGSSARAVHASATCRAPVALRPGPGGSWPVRQFKLSVRLVVKDGGHKVWTVARLAPLSPASGPVPSVSLSEAVPIVARPIASPSRDAERRSGATAGPWPPATSKLGSECVPTEPLLELGDADERFLREVLGCVDSPPPPLPPLADASSDVVTG